MFQLSTRNLRFHLLKIHAQWIFADLFVNRTTVKHIRSTAEGIKFLISERQKQRDTRSKQRVPQMFFN